MSHSVVLACEGLVKEFRLLFVRRVMTSLTEAATAVDPEFDYTRLL